MRIYLFSGLHADDRIFAAQKTRFPQLVVMPRLHPKPDESISSYVRRVLTNTPLQLPCLVGGASFGAILGREAAAQVGNSESVVIGGIVGSEELPWRWRSLFPLANLSPNAMKFLCQLLVVIGRRYWNPAIQRTLIKWGSIECEFERWAILALLRYRPTPATRTVRPRRIHGKYDPIFPGGVFIAERLVTQGRHAISMFQPSDVNDFLAGLLNEKCGQE